jgi:hypothetical protein
MTSTPVHPPTASLCTLPQQLLISDTATIITRHTAGKTCKTCNKHSLAKLTAKMTKMQVHGFPHSSAYNLAGAKPTLPQSQ